MIAGHVDSRNGPAVFYDLRELAPGTSLTSAVRTAARPRFTVLGTEQYPKDEFPTQAVYGPTPDAELRPHHLRRCVRRGGALVSRQRRRLRGRRLTRHAQPCAGLPGGTQRHFPYVGGGDVPSSEVRTPST